MKESTKRTIGFPEQLTYIPATCEEVESLIKKLEEQASTPTHTSELVLFKSRFNRLKKDKEQGIITAEVFQVELNRLRLNLNDSLRVL